MKSITDYDLELAQLAERHQRIWGEICQLQAERNLALTQYARANAQSATAPCVQMARWNDCGHVNRGFDVGEMLR